MAEKRRKRQSAQELIDRAMEVDPALAEDIREFARGHEYGMVFERSPEAMRLFGKPVVKGDVVHILPERGEKETRENWAEWRVADIVDDVAQLTGAVDERKTAEARLEDVVAIASTDQAVDIQFREVARVERGGGTLGDPGDKPYHVLVNGENFHVLQAMETRYAGKVDCIYIDPPFNNGRSEGTYTNRFTGKGDAYRHSRWLSLVERRLKQAKKLLNPQESVLIMAIDEKEYLQAGMLIEQVFPEARIQMVSTLIRPGGVSRGYEFNRTNEFLFFVQLGNMTPLSLELSDEWLGGVKHTMRKDVYWRPLRRTSTNSLRSQRPHSFFPIFVNADGRSIHSVGAPYYGDNYLEEVKPPDGTIVVWPLFPDGREGIWQVSPENIMKLSNEGYLRLGGFTDNGMSIFYLSRGERKKVETGEYRVVGHREDGSIITDASDYVPSFTPGTIWQMPSHNAATYGTSLLKRFVGHRKFSYPKSLYAVEDALRFYVMDKKDALILDFYAGSGTTAHAVMRLNHQDGGCRRSISITNNEVFTYGDTAELLEKKLRQGDEGWERYGIARYITWPRIEAAITGKTPDGEPIQGDYGVKADEYQEIEGDVLNPKTGKKMRGRFFKKTKAQSKMVPDSFPMADGFDENAVFLEAVYSQPTVPYTCEW